MDILNFISWIKSGEYRTTLPTDTPSLIPVGAKDPTRDDGYRSLAINAAPLQSLYNTGNVTQLTSINTAVTVNALNGIITTVPSTLAALNRTSFIVNNDKVVAGSRILVSVEYPLQYVDPGTGVLTGATGLPVLEVANITTGQFRLIISNVAPTFALNYLVKVHFIIVS